VSRVRFALTIFSFNIPPIGLGCLLCKSSFKTFDVSTVPAFSPKFLLFLIPRALRYDENPPSFDEPVDMDSLLVSLVEDVEKDELSYINSFTIFFISLLSLLLLLIALSS